MAQSQPKYIRSFTKIAKGSHGYVSCPANDVESKPDEPDVILVMGWMNAKLSHIQKYTEEYGKIYPGATVVVVMMFQAYHFSTMGTIMRQMKPVAKKFIDLAPKRLLVQAFSGGGPFYLIALIRAIQLESGKRNPIPASAIVFDSCPGAPRWESDTRTFIAGLKNPVAYYAGLVAINIFFATVWVYLALTFQPHPVDKMRADLLDPTLLPHAPTPRAFVYSKADTMVHWEGIASHVEGCKRLGISVDVDVRMKSKHVDHMREDPEKYFAFVQKTWRKGLEGAASSAGQQ